jgi:hypothetical protein
VVITRCRVSNHILLRWNPEWDDLNVVNSCNKEQSLEGKNRRSLNRMLVDCINDTGIIAGEADRRSLPLVMPEKKGVQNGEELLPVDSLEFVL